MSAMLREAGLLKELEAAKERIRQLEAQSVPEGFVMVPKTIHPFDRPDCDAVVQLLATPPDAGRIDNPQDYYQYWWSLLLSAAPEGKK